MDERLSRGQGRFYMVILEIRNTDNRGNTYMSTTNTTNKKKAPRVTLRVIAKCSDMFNAELIEDGKQTGSYDGYVPGWFPNPEEGHYGDYVDLEIDMATGQILNWRKPLKDDLIATFGAKD
jgi:hypothetical protein